MALYKSVYYYYYYYFSNVEVQLIHFMPYLQSNLYWSCIKSERLQLVVVSSAKLNHSAPAACDECSGSSHHELVVAWPCEASSEAATLAAGWAKNYIQAVTVHASHPHWTSTTVPVRLCIHSFCTQCMQIPAEVTGSADYVLPRTRTRFGERGFSYCGPAAWNTLPSDLHDITDIGTFRKRLKSLLSDRAYHWLLLAFLDVSYSGALQISRWLIDWRWHVASRPLWASTRKVKPIWILLKQETVSGSGISWATCKSAPRSRQITTPAPHHSVFTGRMPFLPPNQQRQITEGETNVLAKVDFLED